MGSFCSHFLSSVSSCHMSDLKYTPQVGLGSVREFRLICTITLVNGLLLTNAMVGTVEMTGIFMTTDEILYFLSLIFIHVCLFIDRAYIILIHYVVEA